jgi:transposase
MITLLRSRERHSHVLTDASKIAEIETMCRLYQELRRETVHRYWPLEFLPLVLHNPGLAVTARRHNGEAAQNPLNSHQQGRAISSGLDVIRGSWEQDFAAARSKAARRKNAGLFTEAEVHEINWLLRWPNHLVSILQGQTVVPDPKRKDGTENLDFRNNDHAKLCRWLKGALEDARPGQPALKHKVFMEIESGTYRVRSAKKSKRFSIWLSVPGLTKGKPLKIPMAGDDPEFLDTSGNLSVFVVQDSKGRKRLLFRKAVEIEVGDTLDTRTEEVGLDKGANNAIVATSSGPEQAQFLGTDMGAVLRRRSDRSYRRGRSQLQSRADNSAGRFTSKGRFHGNPNPTEAQKVIARHIRRNNLGTTRHDNEERKAQAEIKNLCGRSARELVEAFPEARTFYEEQLNFVGENQSRGKDVNRKLNRWTKGELSESIESHVSAGRASRQLVKAAYTSQACPVCFWTDKGNRKDGHFECQHCGYSGHADAVASSNVLTRGRDRTISLFTSYKEVKKILLEQHARWRESAGPDARCASRGCGLEQSLVSPNVLDSQEPF